jgi:hypothetical protein
VWRSRTPVGVRCVHYCYHNNTGSKSTVVETVELREVVYRVAEPKSGRYTEVFISGHGFLECRYLLCNVSLEGNYFVTMCTL